MCCITAPPSFGCWWLEGKSLPKNYAFRILQVDCRNADAVPVLLPGRSMWGHSRTYSSAAARPWAATPRSSGDKVQLSDISKQRPGGKADASLPTTAALRYQAQEGCAQGNSTAQPRSLLITLTRPKGFVNKAMSRRACCLLIVFTSGYRALDCVPLGTLWSCHWKDCLSQFLSRAVWFTNKI